MGFNSAFKRLNVGQQNVFEISVFCKNDTIKSNKTLDRSQLNAEQNVMLARFVSRHPATASQALSETKNSYDIIHGHYPVTCSQFHI